MFEDAGKTQFGNAGHCSRTQGKMQGLDEVLGLNTIQLRMQGLEETKT